MNCNAILTIRRKSARNAMVGYKTIVNSARRWDLYQRAAGSNRRRALPEQFERIRIGYSGLLPQRTEDRLASYFEPSYSQSALHKLRGKVARRAIDLLARFSQFRSDFVWKCERNLAHPDHKL